MALRVNGVCEICLKEWAYLFGKTNSFEEFDYFLKMYETKQIDLFNKDNFYKVYHQDMLENFDIYQKSDENQRKEILEKNYDNIINFFYQEEINLIKKNILRTHNIEVFTVFNMSLPPQEREFLYVPLLDLSFLDGTTYSRKYDDNTLYANFKKDHSYLGCPRCEAMSVKYINEEYHP
ncbi:hypothetical protein [Mycoplasma leonicaptivi]|uniref:hypothetical protein n=1 Tax=Mycoplasma leonicaptivi TaxID=36742 RepID=UPI0004896E79|nr:hypothetical protein [Mycoplasma leonicaptivi]